MRRFGLIGFPLSHSFSQKYFTEKFLKEGIRDCLYENFPIPEIGELKKIISETPGLEGLNVTIPFKLQVISMLDDLTHLPIRACNCIKISGGKLIGYNTDIVGFERSFIADLRSTWHFCRKNFCTRLNFVLLVFGNFLGGNPDPCAGNLFQYLQRTLDHLGLPPGKRAVSQARRRTFPRVVVGGAASPADGLVEHADAVVSSGYGPRRGAARETGATRHRHGHRRSGPGSRPWSWPTR